ncbi:HID1-like protein 2, possible Golgi protein (by similarity) [Schizosaccharomyces osmophilus]|uniref:HID1-like protein 2, possible Golgi protein By similarity n=1 Tax=Schizosaccharomyces osmophilus TaxID=2545709 RepID=A0AAF0AVD4_9SCHI|nr:HID1-like protein 2, possible Golgi protein (by similarity) [Schizosaccharomyces osmophilus]WBW71839.1 HID1-like protein 2, possible Golgi protein (by similarity) [Schizosaccharomyces osmophilus]
MGVAESKLSFRNSLLALLKEPAKPEDYQVIFNSLINDNDVFSLIFPKEILQFCQGEEFSQLALLVQICLWNIIYYQKNAKKRNYIESKKPLILNSVRILTRLIPYLYESKKSHSWIREYLFSSPKDAFEKMQLELDISSFYPGFDLPTEVCLLSALLNSVLQICFLPGLSLSIMSSDGEKIWSSGLVFQKLEHPPSYDHQSHQLTLLRFLMVLISEPLYQSQGRVNASVLEHLLALSNRNTNIRLVCSLINTAFINSSSWLPNMLSQSSDVLRRYSALLLLQLISIPKPKTVSTNTVLDILRKLHRPEDLHLLATSLFKTISLPLKNSLSMISFFQNSNQNLEEALIFFFLLLTNHFRFANELEKLPFLTELISSLLYIFINYDSNEDANIGFIAQVAGYCLQQILSKKELVESFAKCNASSMLPPTSQKLPIYELNVTNYILLTLITHINDGHHSQHLACLVVSNILLNSSNLPLMTLEHLITLISHYFEPDVFLTKKSNAILSKRLLSGLLTTISRNLDENYLLIKSLKENANRFEPLLHSTNEDFNESLQSYHSIHPEFTDSDLNWYHAWFSEFKIPLLRDLILSENGKSVLMDPLNLQSLEVEPCYVEYNANIQDWIFLNLWRITLRQCSNNAPVALSPWSGTAVTLFSIREEPQASPASLILQNLQNRFLQN